MRDDNLIEIPGVTRTFNRLRVLFVLLLSMGISLMAVSSVNVALHTIETGLGASTTDIQWVLSGYALAFGITLIPAGRAGDIMGRGTWFIVGMVIFVVGSLACGLAPNPFLLNVARVLQGLGAGLFSPQVTGMIQQYFRGPDRARAYALLGLVISASVAVGPVLAGAIIQAAGPATGWRWAFFTYIPIGVAAGVLALWWFPFETERAARVTRTRAKVDLDPVGTLLVAAIVCCVMVPFMSHTAWTWLLLGLAPLVVWAWIAWERRYERHGGAPVVDLGLFQYRSYRNGILVSGATFLGMTSTFAVTALYLQTGLGVDALSTGLIGLPNAVLSAFAATWSVRFVVAGHGRRLVAWALVIMLVGTVSSLGVAWLVSHAGWSFWWLAVTLSLNGLGMGALGSANQTLAMHDVPAHHGGTAGGLKQTVERITTAIGNAVITGIFFAFVTLSTWSDAYIAAFSAITLCLTLALVLALSDERQHRSAR